MWNVKLDIKKNYSKKEIKVFDFSDGLNKVFEYPNSSIEICIKDKYLSIPIAYDFSDMLETIIFMLEDVKRNEVGHGLYGFPQNTTFDADWRLNWDSANIKIVFEWRMIKNRDTKLFPKNIVIKKRDFVESWEKMFSKLLDYIPEQCLKDTWDRDLITKLISDE